MPLLNVFNRCVVSAVSYLFCASVVFVSDKIPMSNMVC